MRSTPLETDRLLMRRWRDEDRRPFAALNADPRVVEYLPGALSRAESDTLLDRIDSVFDLHGFGRWAVERIDTNELIGFVGLASPRFETHFTPCVEIGWRLSADHWGSGYATEAAHAALGFAFGPAGLDELVSFTVPDNTRSRAVMERLGMSRDPAEDFDHPSLPEGHRLRRHVLYRLCKADYSPDRICT